MAAMQTGPGGPCTGDMWDIVFTTTFTCKRCQYRTSYLRDVERHIIYAHCGEVPYQCAACLSLFLSSAEALDHVQQLHGSRSRHIIENGPARWRQFQTFISRCSLVLEVDHVAGTLFLCALCEQMRTHDFAELLRHLVSTHKWWLAQPTTTCNVCAYQRISRISELDILRVEDLMSYNGHALGACLRSCFKIVLRNAGANEAWGSSASLLQRMGFQANMYPMPNYKDSMDRRKVTFVWQPNSIPIGMSSSPATPFNQSPCDCEGSFCPVLPAASGQNSAQPLGASTLQLMEAINQRYRNQSVPPAAGGISNDFNSPVRRPATTGNGNRGRWRRRGGEIRGVGIPRRSLSFDGTGPTSAERLVSLCANSISGSNASGNQNVPGIKQEAGADNPNSLLFSFLHNQQFSASASLLFNQRNTSSGKAFLPPRALTKDKGTLTGQLAALWGGVSDQFSLTGSGFTNGGASSSVSTDVKTKPPIPGVSQSGEWSTDTTSSEESLCNAKDQIASLEKYMSSKYLGMTKECLKGKLHSASSFSETLDNLAKQAAASASDQRDGPYPTGSYAAKNLFCDRKLNPGAAVEDVVPDSSMAFSSDVSDHDGSENGANPLDLSRLDSKSAEGAVTEDNMDIDDSGSVDDNQSSECEPLRPDEKGVVNIIPVDLSVSKKQSKMYGFCGLPLDLTRKESGGMDNDKGESHQSTPRRNSGSTRNSSHSRKQSTPSKASVEEAIPFADETDKSDHEKDHSGEDLMKVLDRFFGDLDGNPFGGHILEGIGDKHGSDSGTDGSCTECGSDTHGSPVAKIARRASSSSSTTQDLQHDLVPSPKDKTKINVKDEDKDMSDGETTEEEPASSVPPPPSETFKTNPKNEKEDKDDVSTAETPPGEKSPSSVSNTESTGSDATGKAGKSADDQFIDLT